jgi:hypothetical protein
MRNVLGRELARLRGGRFTDADDGGGSDGTVDVLTGDAAVSARPLYSRRVDAVLQAGAPY